jgi:predicted SnoaL-like aldol condensation-catalyzing enzyme
MSLLSFASLFISAISAAHPSNKEIVTSFYSKAFNDHDPIGAMKQFVGEKYIQHNPFVGDGKQPFINFFLDFQKKHPDSQIEIKRVVAEGDLVVVHVHSKLNSTDLGRAVMDIFRLEKGKIVEHWDVGQPIPEKSANDNTMF